MAHRALPVAIAAWVVLAVMLPSSALAQASISGIVRDSSGAVLPGVTVEASSPALIERVRSVTTDGSGQYQVIDLRPGTYTVTFSLSGFTSVKREGIELTGSFAAAVNSELSPGAVQELITVTAEAPTVDVQNVTRQRVMDAELLAAIPTGRTHFNAAILIPGMTGGTDVGGANSLTPVFNMSLHGGRGGDTRIMVDGLSTQNAELAGQASNFLPNMGSAQELAIDYAAGAADQPTGGVRINLIPREGGNIFTGSFFVTGVNSAFQGDNYSDELRTLGLRTPDSIKANYDINPSGGGPIRRDSIWWYASARWNLNQNYVGDLFFNRNAGDPNAWTYAPDLERPAFSDFTQRSLNARVTWQATPKHKFSVFVDDQDRCQCPNVFPNRSPEAANNIDFPLQRLVSGAWTSPLSNRLLLEVRGQRRLERYDYVRPSAGDPALQIIPVTDQASGLLYRGGGYGSISQPSVQPYQVTLGDMSTLSGALSYVTGTHAFKVGFMDVWGTRDSDVRDSDTSLSYRVNTVNGVTIANQLRMNATPFRRIEKQRAELGIYAQDTWKLQRLTMNLGVRFDYYGNYFPEQHLGPGRWVPTRDITLPETPWVDWKDVTPRIGASYDLFGDGTTAIKGTINKYMLAFGLQGIFGESSNPVSRMANFVTRNWNDANRDFVPDCDLFNPQVNGECAAMSDLNFGKPIPTTAIDEAIIHDNRGYNWEFSAGIQRQLVPRVSVDLSYFRRLYGNFVVTDNRATSPADFDPFSITAPTDPRLPNGGGYQVNGLYNLNPARVGRVDNLITQASDYGKQIERWNGFDLTMNARLRDGAVLQGGLSTGRTLTDDCEVRRALDNPSELYCRTQTPFLTQFKLLGAYTVPRVDLQVSATFQSVPGPQIIANYIAPNAAVQPSLGRPLSAGASNVTVNLVSPGTMYGERLNQLDFRIAKILRARGIRAALNLDIYNVTNADTVLTQNNNYATWMVPQSILQARFARISAQVDF